MVLAPPPIRGLEVLSPWARLRAVVVRAKAAAEEQATVRARLAVEQFQAPVRAVGRTAATVAEAVPEAQATGTSPFLV